MHLVDSSPVSFQYLTSVNSIEETDLSPQPMGRKEKSNPPPHMPHASPGVGVVGVSDDKCIMCYIVMPVTIG